MHRDKELTPGGEGIRVWTGCRAGEFWEIRIDDKGVLIVRCGDQMAIKPDARNAVTVWMPRFMKEPE